jgi:hypothetical protein
MSFLDDVWVTISFLSGVDTAPVIIGDKYVVHIGRVFILIPDRSLFLLVIVHRLVFFLLPDRPAHKVPGGDRCNLKHPPLGGPIAPIDKYLNLFIINSCNP